MWKEAGERYEKVGIIEGVAESATHLALLALDAGNIDLALNWLDRADVAAKKTSDTDTHKIIDEVRKRLEERS